jgi:hypothetical protein
MATSLLLQYPYSCSAYVSNAGDVGAQNCAASPGVSAALSSSSQLSDTTYPILKLETAKLAPESPTMGTPIVAQSSAVDQSRFNGRIGTVDPDTSVGRVDELTRQILIKEIELEKFNLHYKRETTKQGRWKGLRYAAFQEANFGLNLTNGIISTGERGQHLTNPAHVSANRVGVANIIGMTGSWIGAGGAGLELAILGYHDLQARREGYSPAEARKHVLELRAQIDNLLAERDAMISIESSAPLLQGHAEIDAAEGKVLTDVRNLTLFEYARFHQGSARYLAFQQALYSFDFAKFTCSALGSLFAYMALHKHDRLWNTRAGIMFEVSGALIVATPYASRGIGLLAAKIQKHKVSPVSKGLENMEVSKLEADKLALDTLCQAHADQAKKSIDRAYIYSVADKSFQDQLHQNLREQRAGRMVGTQNYLSGTFVGGTKIASGVLFNVVGREDNKHTLHDDRVTNYNLFAAAILATTGSGVALLDTARIQIYSEINRHRMAKQGLLPGQIINARLAQLDDMEHHLSAPAQ